MLNWRVEYFSDLSAAWLSLTGSDWHATVEPSRCGGLQYDAWLAIDETQYTAERYVRMGPFDSIEAARRAANAMASQWLLDNGRVEEALSLGEALPTDIWADLRAPEDLSYAGDVAEPAGEEEGALVLGAWAD